MNKYMKHLMTFLVVATLSFTACSKKPKTDDTNIPSAANADENMNGDSDSGKAMGLQTVHFAYDAFTLDSATKSTLKSNAQILKDKASVKIQVEGHCDNRGGIQYNVALGEKRANSVKKFLQAQGVSADRVTTISFGKEKPIAQGDTEEAYAQNRRANFAITAR
jgi:peptidoglycan-associated lipoprotein